MFLILTDNLLMTIQTLMHFKLRLQSAFPFTASETNAFSTLRLCLHGLLPPYVQSPPGHVT
jgi:hypothetical protein